MIFVLVILFLCRSRTIGRTSTPTNNLYLSVRYVYVRYLCAQNEASTSTICYLGTRTAMIIIPQLTVHILRLLVRVRYVRNNNKKIVLIMFMNAPYFVIGLRFLFGEQKEPSQCNTQRTPFLKNKKTCHAYHVS